MIKLNHKNDYVCEIIDDLESEIKEHNKIVEKEVLLKTGTDVITLKENTYLHITYKYKGYMWTVEHWFNSKNMMFEVNCLLSVWQLDDCPDPIFEV